MTARNRRTTALRSVIALTTTAVLTAVGMVTTPAHAADLKTVQELQPTPSEISAIKAKNLKFCFLTNNIADDFSRTLVAGGKAQAAKLGVGLTVNSADFDANKQLAQFNACVQKRVNGIFLTAVNADTIGAGVSRANAAKIPVFIVGGAPARGKVISVMNAASYQGSYDVTNRMMKRIGKKNAKIAILGIPFALQTIRDREKGVLDAVGANGGQVIALQSDFSQDKLLQMATSIIQANPDLDGIVATWSLAVNAALAAVKQSGKPIKIAGYDSEVAGYEALASGNPNLIALSGQQAYVQGVAAINGLAQANLGKTLAPEIITPNLEVTPLNYKIQWKQQYPGGKPPF
jgi:ribose transport system substrate-binding protein